MDVLGDESTIGKPINSDSKHNKATYPSIIGLEASQLRAEKLCLEALKILIQLAKDSGIRKIIPLSVSAPFHCSLMEPAAENMEIALKNIELVEPDFPIISNVSSIPETSTQIIKNNLILHLIFGVSCPLVIIFEFPTKFRSYHLI